MVRPKRMLVMPKAISARLANLDAEALAASLLRGVETATGARWDAAVERAAALPGDIRPEKIRALTRSFARELGMVGAAAGMTAATPLIGTGATLMAATAELTWFTARAGDLVLTIAALHGRPTPTVDERRAWVLAVLVFGSTARQGLTGIANSMGAGLTEGSPSRMSLATLRAANGAMSRLIVRGYGARRGAIALGTALPLGVGAVVGGSANVVAIRRLADQADAFFARLPYSSIDATSTVVAGEP
ncbi:unannotated protein [freshwater metagenome]|uniref:Unannotated protein n=1 Tax=freshwater metagenome TaxID=449393 RepID=A0A6J7ECT7_9ZZZZ|nr:hypothetical protein [Actinomycetota bacterium]